jgi:hypothetical protein
LPPAYGAPPGYFDELPARLLARLDGLPQTAHEPYRIPPGYLEDFSRQLLQRLQGLPSSVPQPRSRFQWRRNWALVPVGAVAALALVVFTVLPQQRQLSDLEHLSLTDLEWPTGFAARQYVENELMYSFDEYEIAQALDPGHPVPDQVLEPRYAEIDTPPPTPQGTPAAVPAGADTALYELNRGLDDLFNSATDTELLRREIWLEAGSETL